MYKAVLTKKDLSILIGNSLDHFDTALYSFLAPILAPVFFSYEDPVTNLILAYSVLATSIITRPLGSYLFGYIAINSGALYALSYSLIGVAITTMLVGFIPDYHVIGWPAPVMLIMLRIVQGIFAEGENSIARLYILENKVHIKAFKASYLYQGSTLIGIIAASFVSTILIASNYHQYWRLCFILGGASGIVGYLLRRYPGFQANPVKNYQGDSCSSKAFTESCHKRHKNVGLAIFWRNKSNIFCVAIVTGFSYVTYIIPFLVMNSFVPLITGISLEQMMGYNTILLIIDMLLIPLIGNFVKKFNETKIMIISLTILAITILPLWAYLDQASLIYVTFVRLWIIFWGIAFLCPVNLWLNNLFQGSEKYMLVGMGNALGSSIFGRLTPTICLLLWHVTNISIYIAFYIALIAVAAIWAIKTAKQQRVV